MLARSLWLKAIATLGMLVVVNACSAPAGDMSPGAEAMLDDRDFMLFGRTVGLIRLGPSDPSLSELVDGMVDHSGYSSMESGTVFLEKLAGGVVRVEHEVNGATVAIYFHAVEQKKGSDRLIRFRPIVGWQVDASGKTIAMAAVAANGRIETFTPALVAIAQDVLAARPQ